MTGSACLAPHAGLYFQPDGVVRPCCTTRLELGRIRPGGAVTIRSIWEGAERRRHRDHLDGGDFSLGCQECEVLARAGRRDQSLAHHFDRYAGPPRPGPRMMDFALSNRCNLQCVMCNGGLSSSIRRSRERLPPLPQAYDDAFFTELAEFLPGLERAQFKGGEPFLSPETLRVFDLLIDLHVDCEVSVTTNATVCNEKVEDYLLRLRMQPIISVDGMTAPTLESIRVGIVHDAFWHNVDRIQEIAEHTGSSLTLSWCLMPQNWHELADFLHEVERRGANPNVILVNQPRSNDLLQLPRDHLEQVIAGLETRDSSVRSLGRPAREAWDAVLRRLRSHLTDPVVLDIRSPDRAPPGVADAAVAKRRTDELVRWGRRPLLRLRLSDGRVERADVPSWAEPLRPDGWLGTPRHGLQGCFDQYAERPVRVTARGAEAGVTELTVELTDAGLLFRGLHIVRTADVEEVVFTTRARLDGRPAGTAG